MKKFTVILAAFAAFAAVSCNKEIPVETPAPEVQDGFKTVTITANIEGQTKTSYDADGKFSWTKGDQISILASNNNYYTFTATETAAASTFTGVLPADVELGTYALYPASKDHSFENDHPYFNIDMYKDLTSMFSADLPMTAIIGENDTYTFKHATSALLFTFTNIPDNIVAVKFSIENESMQFSGRHKSYYSEPWSLTFLEENNTDDDRKFVRKVSVENNTAKVYLPFKGTLWDGYDNIINIVGYDAQENEIVLVENQTMPGNDLAVKTLGVVIPVKALAINNLDHVDWESNNVATVTNAQDSDDAKCEELKVIADEYFMYAWLTCTLETPFNANYIDIYLSDGDDSGSELAWDQWPGTTGVNIYNKEHKGTIGSDGNLTSMTFKYNDNYQKIKYKTEIANGKINWYFAFPINYISDYKSEDNKIYVGFRLWNEWANYAAIPARGWGQSMLEVTLP